MKHNILITVAVSVMMAGCATPTKTPDDEIVKLKINTLKQIVDENPEAALLGTAMIGAAGDPHRSVITAINSNKPDEGITGKSDEQPEDEHNPTTGGDKGAPENGLQKEFEAWKKGLLKSGD